MAKRRRKHKIHWVRLSVCAAVFLAIVFGLFFGVRSIVRSITTVSQDWEKLDIQTQGELTPFQDGVLHFSDTALTYYKSNGSTAWSLPVNTNRLTMHVSDSHIVINTAQLLDVLKSDGTTVLNYSVPAGNITDLSVGKNHIAMQLTKEGQPAILVIDMNGNIVDEVSFVGKNVLKFGFNEQDLLWVLSLNTSAGKTLSQISIYQPGQSMKCAYNVSDQLIYDVAFGADRLYLFGSTKCLVYNYVGDKISETMVYGWRVEEARTVGADSYVLMVPDTLEEGSTVDYAQVMVNGAYTGSYRMKGDTLYHGITSRCMVEVKRNQVILTPMNGKPAEEITLPADVTRAVMAANGSGVYLTAADGSVYYLPVSK